MVRLLLRSAVDLLLVKPCFLVFYELVLLVIPLLAEFFLILLRLLVLLIIIAHFKVNVWLQVRFIILLW